VPQDPELKRSGHKPFTPSIEHMGLWLGGIASDDIPSQSQDVLFYSHLRTKRHYFNVYEDDTQKVECRNWQPTL